MSAQSHHSHAIVVERDIDRQEIQPVAIGDKQHCIPVLIRAKVIQIARAVLKARRHVLGDERNHQDHLIDPTEHGDIQRWPQFLRRIADPRVVENAGGKVFRVSERKDFQDGFDGEPLVESVPRNLIFLDQRFNAVHGCLPVQPLQRWGRLHAASATVTDGDEALLCANRHASHPSSQPMPRPNDLSVIYGKIQLVNRFADYKVQVVEHLADLHVQLVDDFANAPGRWQIVKQFPDYKIQIVNRFPDFKIKYVKTFPGVK